MTEAGGASAVLLGGGAGDGADPDHAAGLAALAAADADLAAVLARFGAPPSRRRAPGFESLVKIIVGQQVSVASADAIWRRLEAGLGRVAPEPVLAAGPDRLATMGLSRPKAAYVSGIAEAVTGGALDLDGLDALADEDAMAALVAIRGIGRWTAEIYLLSALGRPDVWPAGDLALMNAARAVKRLDARPDAGGMIALAEAWRPWRAVAARLLWHYYRHAPPAEWRPRRP